MGRGREIVIEVEVDRLGLLVLLLAVVWVSSFGLVARAESEATTPSAPTVWVAPVPGRYYMTVATYTGADALSACSDGYHMASMWEIMDVSNLIYDTDLGRSQDDSGQGPPAGRDGWVRTGQSASTASVAGQGNCDGWSSDSAGHSGTILWLPSDWGGGADIGGWKAGTGACSVYRSVWCVRQPWRLYLPLTLRNQGA